jgi:cell wall-associated NlpC family hydrolase
VVVDFGRLAARDGRVISPTRTRQLTSQAFGEVLLTVSNHVPGRHRATSRPPALSLSAAISRSARPAAKASAVFALAGGMVASFALPASAATFTTTIAKPKVPAASVVLPIAAPSAAQTPLVSQSFGDIEFSGVIKPKPVVAPVIPRATITSSRSASRPPASQSTPVPAPRSAGVLGIAASLLGVPYLAGGTTTSGFDCSGFTQYVFARLGISLPRTAEEQRQATTPVSTPKVGDLVFFGSPAYHNGIYAGNGMMWDAPRTGKAVGLRSIWSSTVTYGRV